MSAPAPPDPRRLVPRLGAHPYGPGVSFAVYSRGESVVLCLRRHDGAEDTVPMTCTTGDIWHARVEGVGPGTHYGYRVDGPWDPVHGHRFDSTALLVDPYARAVDGAWSVVVEPAFDWQGVAAPKVPWTDTVVYETHVRGFTKTHPAIPEQLRGTYAGLAHPDAIGHLRDLGITTVELLPVHHFVSEPGLVARGIANYWGYSSLGFFAPHAAYSSSGSDGAQVQEFQTMVRELHRAGLEVVLDVVYNHTAEGGAAGPTLSFRGLDNQGYYRLRRDGSYDDTTGCGNSVDLRNHRTLALVTDSLRYWVQEMGVDGFRFDLAPTLARGDSGFDRASPFLAVIAQDPVLSQVKLIAEPWDVGPGGYQLGGFPAPWGEWNDRFRDTVRSTWLGGHGHEQARGLRDLAFRLTGSSDVFEPSGRGPLASVNFVTAHDGFTVHDLVSYDRKHNEANGEHNRDGTDNNHSWSCGVEGPTDDADVLTLRRRMMRNLLTTLLVSSGVPMLTAGDETGRTQRGNNNAYCLDDETSWVSWDHAPWQRDLYEWTRALLALRRETPALRVDRFFDGRPVSTGDGRSAGVVKDLTWFRADGVEMSSSTWFEHDLQVLGMAVTSTGEHPLLVWLNTGPEPTTVVIPSSPWASSYAVLLDTAHERPEPGLTFGAGQSVDMLGHSALVLTPSH